MSKFLYIFWKAIGLCPFTLTDSRKIKFSYTGIIYSIILILLYSYCYLEAIRSRATFAKPHETAMSVIGDIVAKSCQFLMIVTTWSCFAFRQGEFRRIQLFYGKIVQSPCCIIIDEKYHTRVIKKVHIQTALLNFSCLIFYTSGHLQQSNSTAFDAVIWTPFKIGRIVYPNFTIIFITVMKVLRDRFRSLNDNIRNLSREILSTSAMPKIRRRNNSRIEFPSSDPLSGLLEIHSELIDLTGSIVELWSPSLYLTMMISLFQLAANFYDICLNVKYQKASPLEENGYFVALSLWFAFHTVGMVAMIDAAEATTFEANVTGNILHEILISITSTNFHLESMKIQSFRLLKRRLSIKPFGVLPMKYSVLHTIVSLVGAYVIIMMQLDEQQRQRHGK